MKIAAVLYNKFIFRPLTIRKLRSAGKNIRIGYCSELINPQFFSIGDNFFSGPYGYFVTNRNNPVTIGRHVMFGPFCRIIGGNHDFRFREHHMIFNTNIDHMNSEIRIEDGAWIGAHSVILSGAVVSEGSVVGAMSLVNKPLPPYSICAGIPARVIKPRFDKKEDLEYLLRKTGSRLRIGTINAAYQAHGLPTY